MILLLISIIPVRLAIAHYQAPLPQAIFTLGGGVNREEFTAKFARSHPNLEIWISSGAPAKQTVDIFLNAGISPSLLRLDYRAVDTVTNFTSLATDLKSRGIQHVYLITSDFHMPRAKAIATFVFGSKGIAFTPEEMPSDKPLESWWLIVRDTGRAIVWMITGRTGASLNPDITTTPNL